MDIVGESDSIDFDNQTLENQLVYSIWEVFEMCGYEPSERGAGIAFDDNLEGMLLEKIDYYDIPLPESSDWTNELECFFSELPYQIDDGVAITLHINQFTEVLVLLECVGIKLKEDSIDYLSLPGA